MRQGIYLADDKEELTDLDYLVVSEGDGKVSVGYWIIDGNDTLSFANGEWKKYTWVLDSSVYSERLVLPIEFMETKGD